jgi:hypothetical protein
MPVSANTAAKPAVNVLSRSRIRNRNWVARSPRSMSAEVQEQVAGLLGHPGASGMGGDPGDVHAAAAVLDHDKHIEPARETVSTWAKSTARIAWACAVIQTVEAATAWPSPRSSPWIRR